MSQSENTPGKPEFKQLWPTQFMSLSLPGHDTANPVLADHLLEQNIARDDMTVDYTSDNLFMTDHPAVIWLRQCCDRAFWIMRGMPALIMTLNGFCKAGPM